MCQKTLCTILLIEIVVWMFVILYAMVPLPFSNLYYDYFGSYPVQVYPNAPNIINLNTNLFHSKVFVHSGSQFTVEKPAFISFLRVTKEEIKGRINDTHIMYTCSIPYIDPSREINVMCTIPGSEFMGNLILPKSMTVSRSHVMQGMDTFTHIDTQENGEEGNEESLVWYQYNPSIASFTFLLPIILLCCCHCCICGAIMAGGSRTSTVVLRGRYYSLQ